MRVLRKATVAIAIAALSGCLGDTSKLSGKREPAAAGMRSTTQSQRWAARQAQALQVNVTNKTFAGVDPTTKDLSPLAMGALGAAGPGVIGHQLATMAPPGSKPDYFGIPNYANSPLPEVEGIGAYATATIDGGFLVGVDLAIDPATGLAMAGAGYNPANPPSVYLVGQGVGAAVSANIDPAGVISGFSIGSAGDGGYTAAPLVKIVGGVRAGTGLRKFVTEMAGLCATAGGVIDPASRNNLGQCIPLAQPSNGLHASCGLTSDCYEIRVGEYHEQLHLDLPPAGTQLRGYADVSPAGLALGGGAPLHQYLGPIILAHRDRPVRVKFYNQLPTGPAGDLFIPVDHTFMGAGKGPDGTNYSDNRATLHLHGGNSPWISDGTPHQWTTPAGERAFHNFTKGMSTRDVPDMAPTLDGEMTFYWTNQQSGRMMFYHDHAYGITRLNVYAGEAAGYLLVDDLVEPALAAATLPGTITGGGADLAHMLPIVIQERTFVPDNGEAGGQLAATDPTWDLARWGGKGNLWYPHVYMPNQNPASIAGANAFGRWDYGPWFWPPQNPSTFVADGQPYACNSLGFDAVTPVAFPPLMCPGTPKDSATPEAFGDTVLVNGTIYPSKTIDRSAYRFQLLNAANDRSMNLSLFYAATADGTVCKGGAVADLTKCTELSMVPAVSHQPLCSASATAQCVCNGAFAPAGCTPPSGAVPLCSDPNEMQGGGLAVGLLDPATNDILNGTGLPANCWPTLWPVDGRAGGVPDPLTAGPAIVQIGSEGGLLPKAVVIPATPVNYDYNRRSITVLNILSHGLLVGPAERADLVVDFSQVPEGSALILYNDSPAPAPASDPRIDYFTNGPDNSPTGGAPSTIPGYGPNTRTLMQFKVPAGAVNTNVTPYSFVALAAGIPNAFSLATVGTPATPRPDKMIMTGTPYPAANGFAPNDTYVRISDTQVNYFDGSGISSVTLTNGGAGYLVAPQVLIDPPPCMPAPPAPAPVGCVTALAHASLSGSVSQVRPAGPPPAVVVWPAAPAYRIPPTVRFSGGSGTGAEAQAFLRPTNVLAVTLTPSTTVYNSRPTITITPPAPGCPAATVNPASVLWNAATGMVTNAGGIIVTPPAAPLPPGCTLYRDVPIVTVEGGNAQGIIGTAILASAPVDQVVMINGGTGYTAAPAAQFIRAAGSPVGPAVFNVAADLGAMSVSSVVVDNPGQGYLAPPNVQFVAVAADPGAGAAGVINGKKLSILPKTIQELFTLDYGRMNATLGVEVPFTNFLTQTTIPYGYTDPTTELVKDGETQFWKITHNGVDTHWLHFHLFTVQVINRVGWDGAIKPPDDNELGWKDTVRMNPLEDIVVAMRPYNQTLPWQLPNSVRPLDVTQKVGTALPNQFTNVDPTNQPAVTTNDETNFGSEFVWHCHILGHEENDMMRAISFVLTPDAPTAVVSAAVGGPGSGLRVSWADNAINETGFTVQRQEWIAAAGPVPAHWTGWTARQGTPYCSATIRTDCVCNGAAFSPVGCQPAPLRPVNMGALLAASGNVAGPTSADAAREQVTVRQNEVSYRDVTALHLHTYNYRVSANNVVGYTKKFAAPAVGWPTQSGDSVAVETGPRVAP